MKITSKSGDVVINENKSQIYVLEDDKWCEWRVLGGCQKFVWTETKGASCSFLKSRESNAIKTQDGAWQPMVDTQGRLCRQRGLWTQMPGGRGIANKCELSDLHLSHSKGVRTSQIKRMQSKVRCFNNLTVTLYKTRKAKEHTVSLSGDRR